MRLHLENGMTLADPDAVKIDRALRSLSRLTENAFAILEVSDNTYLQTMQVDKPDYDEPYYILEYQDGSIEEHYQSAENLPLTCVIDAFQAYNRDDNSWRTQFAWIKIKL